METMMTFTVATDMMGHVRVTGTNRMTDEVLERELLVTDDDPAVTATKVGALMHEVYVALDNG